MFVSLRQLIGMSIAYALKFISLSYTLLHTAFRTSNCQIQIRINTLKCVPHTKLYRKTGFLGINIHNHNTPKHTSSAINIFTEPLIYRILKFHVKFSRGNSILREQIHQNKPCGGGEWKINEAYWESQQEHLIFL